MARDRERELNKDEAHPDNAVKAAAQAVREYLDTTRKEIARVTTEQKKHSTAQADAKEVALPAPAPEELPPVTPENPLTPSSDADAAPSPLDASQGLSQDKADDRGENTLSDEEQPPRPRAEVGETETDAGGIRSGSAGGAFGAASRHDDKLRGPAIEAPAMLDPARRADARERFRQKVAGLAEQIQALHATVASAGEELDHNLATQVAANGGIQIRVRDTAWDWYWLRAGGHADLFEQLTDLALNEELLHTATLAVWRADWDAAGRRGDFDVYIGRRAKELLRDISDSIGRLRPARQQAAKEALWSAWRAYFPGDGLTPENIATEIMDPARMHELAQSPGGFVMELTRQLVQIRQADVTTETVAHPVFQRLKALGARVLAALRKVAKNIRGHFGRQTGDLIKRVEAALKGGVEPFAPREAPRWGEEFMAQDAPTPDMDRARAAATMPNTPDSESQARPLKDELGGTAQDYTAFTHEDMQRRAAAVVDAVGSVDQMARLLASEDGVRSLGLSPDLQEYVQAETLKRAHAEVSTATNDVDRIRATQTLRKVRALWDVTGTEAGQHLVARKLAGEQLRDGLAQAMSVDTAIEKQQQVTIDRALPVDPVKQVVEQVATDAGPAATEKLADDLTPKADKALETARQKLLAQDSPALAKLLNTLRASIAPDLKWRDIFTSQKHTQREWELEVYDHIRKHEALQDLSPEEQVQLTRELSKAWQRERRAVFNRELEKQLAKVKGVKPAAAEKVKASAPRLLQLINLGALDSAAFRDALAQEWGIKNLNSPEAKALKDLATRAQQAPEGLPRRKLEQQFVEGLQDLTKLTRLEILENWWTASVLSGWRTHADILLSVGNGIEDVGLGAIVTAVRTGNADVAYRAIGKVLSNLPTAIQEALHHVVTGDRSMMRNYDAEVKAAEQDGHKLMSNAGRELLKKGGLYKAPGAFMELIARMLTAWDHLNSSSTFEGAKLMALARHPELYQQALRIGPRERDNARAQARAELTAGAEPTTKTERMQENARVKEILDAELPTEIIAQATELGRDAALQGDPTGLGHAVWWLSRQIGRVPDMGVEAIEKSGADNAAARLVLAALRRASTISRVLTGAKFVRTAAHALNRQVSYVPGVGLLRFAEGNMQGAKSDILIAKQLLGTAVGLTLLAMFRAKDDDEEGIEGSWKGLTPQQRSQLYADGKQPNSVWYRDANGRIVSFNFNQWGIAGIMGTIGAMEDQRRYKGNDSELSILVNGIVTGSMQFTEKAQLQGLQQIFGDSAYSTSGNVTDGLAKRLNRYAATTVGGMVPRIAKDVDAVIAPELRDASQWWAQWAAQVPMLRELSSGKRVDILGQDVEIDRGPLSRVYQAGTADGAYRILGQLNERNLWLPDPSSGVRMVKEPNGERREMSLEEKDRFQRGVGEGYKTFVIDHGAEILAMDQPAAQDYIRKQTKVIRDDAAGKVTR